MTCAADSGARVGKGGTRTKDDLVRLSFLVFHLRLIGQILRHMKREGAVTVYVVGAGEWRKATWRQRKENINP